MRHNQSAIEALNEKIMVFLPYTSSWDWILYIICHCGSVGNCSLSSLRVSGSSPMPLTPSERVKRCRDKKRDKEKLIKKFVRKGILSKKEAKKIKKLEKRKKYKVLSVKKHGKKTKISLEISE